MTEASLWGGRPVRLASLVPAIVLLVLASDLAGIARTASRTEPPCVPSTALVMGAAQYDGRPSPAFARRLDRAAGLYHAGCVEAIVVSGGGAAGDRTTEAAAGVAYLAAEGVPRGALKPEPRARSSAQALRNARPLLGDDGVVIVTDDLHARRVRWLAHRLGWAPVEVATVRAGGARGRYLLREWAALSAYRLGWVP